MIADPKQIQESGSNAKSGSKAPKASKAKAKPGPKPWATNKLQLPVDQAEECGRLGMSYDSMASLFGVDRATIQREFDKGDKSQFAANYQNGRGHLHKMLRTVMIDRATVGRSDACLIFLSKNELGMTDRPLVEIHNTQVTVTEEPLPTFLEN